MISVEFYAYNLILVSFSVVISVITVGFTRKPKTRPLPWFITQLLKSQFMKFLALPTKVNRGFLPEQLKAYYTLNY